MFLITVFCESGGPACPVGNEGLAPKGPGFGIPYLGPLSGGAIIPAIPLSLALLPLGCDDAYLLKLSIIIFEKTV